MNTTQKMNIDREDWISRFYGYLGSFRYLRKKQAISFLEKAGQKENYEAIVGDDEYCNKSDNIVFIYGSPQGGKTEYTQMLISELNQSGSLYQGVRMEFDKLESSIGIKRMQDKLIEVFEQAPFDFTFPCVDYSENAKEYSKVVPKPVYEFISAVYHFTTGDVSAIAELKNAWGGMKKFMTFTNPKLKEMKENLSVLMDEYEKYGDFKRRQEKEPFLWYKLDMFANVRNHKEQIVCVIDNFHLFHKQLTELSERYEFMELLSALSDVVWVLVSEKKPPELIKRYVKKENCWRMAGLDKERSIKHLKRCCPGRERILKHFERDAWYNYVYEKTGGYIGLLQLCIERETRADGESGFEQFCKDRIENGYLTEEELAVQSNPKAFEELLLKKWFWTVWNGEDGGKKTSPIEFLMSEEFVHVRYTDEETEDIIKKYAVPCLCYLISLSNNSDKGTVKQYFWKGNGEGPPFNETGRRILRMITANLPFVLEYVEYPGTFYLDTVIMDVMMQHRHYEMWRDMFKVYEENSKLMGSSWDSKEVNSAEKLSVDAAKTTSAEGDEKEKDALKVLGWFTGQVDDKDATINKQQKEIEILRRENEDLKSKKSQKDTPPAEQLIQDSDFKSIDNERQTIEKVSDQKGSAAIEKPEDSNDMTVAATENDVSKDDTGKDESHKK